MGRSAWELVEKDDDPDFGFIAIDEHTYKGCVIQEITDLGARLIMIDARSVTDDFILFSFYLDKSTLCRAISRNDEIIYAWFNF